MKNNILIIPDVHGRKFWREPCRNIENFEKVIFLGDYVDPYTYEYVDTPTLMEDDIISMLNDIIQLKKDNPEKVVLLMGNHVDHYRWDNMIESSRYSRKYAREYKTILTDNSDLFNLVYIYKDIIFSHAGITDGWAERFLNHYMKYDESAMDCDHILETATILQDTLIKDFTSDYIDALSEISHYRGGDNFYGSCEWADVREHYTKKMSGSSPKFYDNFQVFGHTQLMSDPIITDRWACLDCRKPFVMDSQTKEIKEYV